MKILLSVVLALVFVGCSDDTPDKSAIKQEVTKKEVLKKELPKQEAAKKEIIKQEEVKPVVAGVKTGKDIFLKCMACHGQNAEKSALGKSKVIQGWDTEKVVAALNGYKDGTYGGPMKGLMKAQVSTLSDDDIKLVAEYIFKL